MFGKSISKKKAKGNHNAVKSVKKEKEKRSDGKKKKKRYRL